MKQTQSKRVPRSLRAFSLVEVMVASSIAVMVFATGTLVYQTVTVNQKRQSVFGKLEFENPNALANYYLMSGSTLDAYVAPHYGRAARAENMRDKFWDDVRHASAIFCLGRGLGSHYTDRPDYIYMPLTADAKLLDTPDEFKAHLESVQPSSAGVFETWRGACTSQNGTIFILQPSGFADYLQVRAIYDIDIVPTFWEIDTANGIERILAIDDTIPSMPVAGTYVSVRRYAFGLLTNFYDVHYDEDNGIEAFSPMFVMHERKERLSFVETSYDKFKNAEDMPFYFIWWPDPGVASMTGDGLANAAYASTDPRSTYASMGGKTSFMFTVPMFPGL